MVNKTTLYKYNKIAHFQSFFAELFEKDDVLLSPEDFKDLLEFIGVDNILLGFFNVLENFSNFAKLIPDICSDDKWHFIASQIYDVQCMLAGYRADKVFIRNSSHVPPSQEAVREMMPVLCNLLEAEPNAAVRAVLGHYLFVYIHPYFDGNGRLGCFLMNTMMASGGYPWTVIKLEQRDAYMSALAAASARGEIRVFAEFVAKLMDDTK